MARITARHSHIADFELSLVPGIRPGQVVNPSGLDNYALIFQPIYLQVIGRSLLFAFGTTLICLVLGFPVAYWIAVMLPKRWRNLALVGFVLPLWTSSLLRSYAWITILRPTGVLNSLITSLGLPPLDILNRPSAVFIGMSYGLLPYMVLILYASLEKLDRRLLEAAADLGQTHSRFFGRSPFPKPYRELQQVLYSYSSPGWETLLIPNSWGCFQHDSRPTYL